MPGPYTLGATITLEADFTDPDTGLPLDANDITCRVEQPDGTSVPVTPVTRYAAGKYRAKFPSTLPDEHWYRFASVILKTAREAAFVVSPREVRDA